MTTITTPIPAPAYTPERAVELGTSILDEHSPGWHEGIDLENLRMEIASCCILGQLYGGYYRGLTMLYGHPKDPDEFETNEQRGREHGFDLRRADDSWESLQAAWTRLIESRQS